MGWSTGGSGAENVLLYWKYEYCLLKICVWFAEIVCMVYWIFWYCLLRLCVWFTEIMCMVYWNDVYDLHITEKLCVWQAGWWTQNGRRDKKSILGQDREGVSEYPVDTYRRIHQIDLKQLKLASEKSCQCSENSYSIWKKLLDVWKRLLFLWKTKFRCINPEKKAMVNNGM